MQQLGWPEGTFKRRLEKGRELLRQRLTRRGLTLAAGLFASLMSGTSVAAVPAALKQMSLQNALLTTVATSLRGQAATPAMRLAQEVLF